MEDELLQQKITRESAENAYKKYITQFAEVARLKIAGSYYHQNTDTLYLFGITPFDPPQYYFRKYVARYGEWSPWEKIELSINAYNVSALIQRGRLYLFWVDINTQKNTEVVNGNQVFKNYENKIYLQYSYMNESGKWIPPQKLEYIRFTALGYENEQKFFETGPNSKKFYPVLRDNDIIIGYRWY